MAKKLKDEEMDMEASEELGKEEGMDEAIDMGLDEETGESTTTEAGAENASMEAEGKNKISVSDIDIPQIADMNQGEEFDMIVKFKLLSKDADGNAVIEPIDYTPTEEMTPPEEAGMTEAGGAGGGIAGVLGGGAPVGGGAPGMGA